MGHEMRLRDIGLILDRQIYRERELSREFDFGAEYVCHFLARQARLLELKMDRFNVISVVGVPGEGGPCYRVPDRALRCEVHFDKDRYLQLAPDDWHEFRLSMLEEAIRNAQKGFDVHAEVILELIGKFRSGGYRNEWVAKKKFLEETGASAWFVCSMSPEQFELRLQLRKAGRTIYDEVALTTLPSELIFGIMMNDVRVEGDRIAVFDDFGEEVFSVPAEEALGEYF